MVLLMRAKQGEFLPQGLNVLGLTEAALAVAAVFALSGGAPAAQQTPQKAPLEPATASEHNAGD